MDQYIGKLLDNRYEILDVIGVGGMAMVYKAYCHRLHRFVAVKILRKDLASDAEFRRRFHDEAQAVAMLSHPNIVSVYDVSRGEDLDYIVMELIDGITLKQYMKKKGGSLSWREALHYITQIMRALSHAHGRGIIHRDIKPQNIMVLRDGSVRVADFGIARMMSAAQNTLTQEALGSVHYISPEQARGSHIDDRADIYSAGVVLYEMLTGRLPFEGDSPVSVAIQHISSIPLSPRELNQEIPEALESITLKAMASNVDHRYKSAEDMIRDLEEFRKNPNINFGYEHHGMMMQSDEPTQILEATGSLGKQKPVSRATGSQLDQYEYEIYEGYRKNGERRPVERQKKENHSAMIPIVAVVTVFLIGVGVFLWMFFFSNLFRATEPVIVPNFVGKTIEEVMADEAVMSRFEISKDVKYEPSEEYAKGQIIRQSPEANTELKGERIELSFTVSSGQDYVKMINVNNMPYPEARVELEKLGLVVKEPEYQYNDEVVIHHVISSFPPEGTPMTPGESVHLVVSRGTEDKMVTVPSLYTLTRSEAEKMLRDDYQLNCNVKEINDNAEAGTVINQSTPPGTQVKVGTTITIQVSKGPAGDTVKTKNFTINLPKEPEMVTVQVKVGGEEQYNNQVSTANGSITIEISGSGKQEVVVYINGDEQKRSVENFDT